MINYFSIKLLDYFQLKFWLSYTSTIYRANDHNACELQDWCNSMRMGMCCLTSI